MSLSLVLASPGVGGGLLFAQALEKKYGVDPKSGQAVQYTVPKAPSAGGSSSGVAALLQKLRDPRLKETLSQEQLDHAAEMLKRYQGDLGSGETEKVLAGLVKDFGDPNIHPDLALAELYNRLSEFARFGDTAGTYVDPLFQSEKRSLMAVRSSVLGKTLYTQEGVLIDFKVYRNTIRRPDPKTGEDVLDSIVIQSQKGAADEQKVVYNRRVHLMLKNLKKLYYDQPALWRQIKDPKTTPEAKAELEKNYYENRNKPALLTLIHYLGKLNRLESAGTLDKLGNDEYKALESVQRTAMKFYNDNQLEMMQKYVLIQLTSGFSQITNTQAKQKKDGKQNLDVTQKSLAELQNSLTQYERGNLAGYPHLMQAFGLTQLSHEDQKYITPELMAIASEAFADVAFAVKAKGRLFQARLSAEEQDAAIEESQQWLKLAQIHLQTFEMHTLKIQLEKLKRGELSDRVGLEDAKMKLEAMRLINTAQGQYLPKLDEAVRETKDVLLKQAVASFEITYRNAVHAYLYEETIQERVRTLAAKAGQMKALYLAREFEKVKDTQDFKGRSALEKLVGNLYQYYLKNLPAKQAHVAGELERFAQTLEGLARRQNPSEIRMGLEPLESQWHLLAALLGYRDLPDMETVQKDSLRSAIKQGKVFAAVTNFSSHMRLFDMVNELDIYATKYASSKNVSSESETTWSYLRGFKWLEQGYGKVKGRDHNVERIQKYLDSVAFQKLVANKEMRKEALALLAEGKYNQAKNKIALLDPEAAKKAKNDYQEDRIFDDRFEKLDFDGFMNLSTEDLGMVGAQGSITSGFNFLPRLMMSYNKAAIAVDGAITIVATAGLGQLVGYAGQAARWTSVYIRAASMVRIGETATMMNRMAMAARQGINMINGVSKTWGIRTVVAVPTAWARNFTSVVDFAKMPKNLSLIQKGWNAGEVFLKVSLPNAAVATANSAGMMALASGGTQAAVHYFGPESSQFQSTGDAFSQGAIGGAAFGARGAAIMMVSPFPSTAFGAGKIGNTARGIAEAPGLVTGGIQLAAKILRPNSVWAKMNGISIFEGWALRKSAAFSQLVTARFGTAAATVADGAAYLGVKGATWSMGMVEGAGKYFAASEVPKEVAGLAHYKYQSVMESANNGKPIAPNYAGATQEVSKSIRANDFAQGVSQSAWIFLPVNPMYSARQIKEYMNASAAGNYFLSKGRALEMQRGRDGDKMTAPKPYYMGSIKEMLTPWRGRSQLELTISPQSRQMATQFLAKQNNVSKAEIMAGALATSKDHGKTTSVAELLNSLHSGKIKEVTFAKSSKGDAVDVIAGRRSVTNDSIEANKELFRMELHGNAVLRKDILESGNTYIFKDPSGSAKVKGEKLRELKNLASMENLERGLGVSAWGRVVDTLSGRRPETKYDVLVKRAETAARAELKGEPHKAVSAERVVQSSQKQVQDMIQNTSNAVDKAALNQVRQSIESAAYTRYVNEEMVGNFKAYKSGRLGKEKLKESIVLFKEVWEKGVFGQMFGTKKSRMVDGKKEFYYDIPAQYQFKDAHGRPIEKFNELQEKMILENLERIAEGKPMIFDLLSTGGGKTLLSFVMLDFMQAYSRTRGREGTYFVTTNGELVAQAQEAYQAFFKGRKPPFEIMTYSDLMARLAQADSMGTVDPFKTHDMVWDEAEEPGMKTALSLGMDKGRMRYPKVDPAVQALGKSIAEIFNKNNKYDRKLDKIFDPKDAGRSMNEGQLADKVKSDPKFAALRQDFIKRNTLKLKEAIAFAGSKGFRDGIDPSLYPGMTREQIAIEVYKDHKNAYGGWFEMGVVKEQHGVLENYLAGIFDGAYLARSQKDLTQVYKFDAERGKVYMIHNDTVYENLATQMRATFELAHGLELTHDYGTINVTDYRRLNEAARDGESLIVGMSGTLADGIIPFMKDEIGWHIQGRGTDLPPVMPMILKGGKTVKQGMVDAVKTAHKNNTGGKGPKDVVVIYAESQGKSEALIKALKAVGIDESRISVAVKPGSNFDTQNLHKGTSIEKEKNVAALQKGEVDVVLLVGQDGLRGLDLSFDAYKGGKLKFITSDPETLAMVSQKQLFGRTLGKRVPGSTTKTYYLMTQANTLMSNKQYTELVGQKMREASENLQTQRWDRLSAMLKDKVPAGKTLKDSIEEILKADPMLYKERQLYMHHQTIGALREYFIKKEGSVKRAEAALKNVLKDPKKLSEASVEPEVFKILVWEMQKKAELEAMNASGVLDRK